MLAFLYALVTAPYFGLMALIRSWIWILAVMGAFAMMGEVGNPYVLILLFVVVAGLSVVLGFSIAREALVSAEGEWAIHADVPWMSAMWKYVGASLLAFLWIIVCIAVLLLVGIYLARFLPEDTLAQIPAYLLAKAEDPYAPVPGFEAWDAALMVGVFALGVPAAVFTTTYVAAGAGNGLLSRNGWTIGRGTLRMAIAAVIFGWLSWHACLWLISVAVGWAPEVALGTIYIGSFALNWAMLMGCAAQVYLRRLEWDLTRESKQAEHAFDDGVRQSSARDLRTAWMSQDR